MKTFSSAVKCIEEGYSIIPIGNDKRPRVKWKQWQTAKADVKQVEQWIAFGNDHNFGIVTGKISGITVVDIDVKHAKRTPLDTFPETYTVQTPSGGWHLYYQYSDTVQTCSDRYPQFPYVDIRNDGGYVVAPPSFEGGYKIIKDLPIVAFPADMFGGKKKLRLRDTVKLSSGSRNDSIASTAGTFLRAYPEGQWESDVWPVIVGHNETYKPPLPLDELKTTFKSIATRELARRKELQLSPLHIDSVDAIKVRLRKNRNGGTIKDMSNAIFALENSEQYKTVRYDTFTNIIMLGGVALLEEDTLEAQKFLQTDIELHNIGKNIVEDALNYIAHKNKFSSALAYLEGLSWDGVARVDTWLIETYGVPDDEYHRAVGSNWLRALVGRIKNPGLKYDHVLVVEGAQGVRKSSSFAALGGAWHTETTIQADNKDFLLQFNGKAIVEFSEGGTLSKSETKALKSIITRTHDKYRAPYARQDREYPRQCIFCMTTNDDEYLKDETGNRRWLPVRMPAGFVANCAWITENRDQLFAEAYRRVDEPTWHYPKDVAEQAQEERRIVDSLEESITDWYTGLDDASRDEGITIKTVHDALYKHYDRIPPVIDKPLEWRIKNILRAAMKLEPRQSRVQGVRARRWFPTTKTPPKNDFTDGFF